MIRTPIMKTDKSDVTQSNACMGYNNIRFGLRHETTLNQYDRRVSLKQYNGLQRGYPKNDYKLKISKANQSKFKILKGVSTDNRWMVSTGKDQNENLKAVLSDKTISQNSKDTAALVEPLETQSLQIAGLAKSSGETKLHSAISDKSMGDQHLESGLLQAGLTREKVLDEINNSIEIQPDRSAYDNILGAM